VCWFEKLNFSAKAVLEIEDNGDPTYEFGIVNGIDAEAKVEVDAVTGKIIEVAIEGWEVGEETDERR
jgi:hypothetical protein